MWLDNYNIGDRAYVAVLDMPEVTACATFDRKYTGIAKFPAVTRDISMVMDKSILVGQVEDDHREARRKAFGVLSSV